MTGSLLNHPHIFHVPELRMRPPSIQPTSLEELKKELMTELLSKTDPNATKDLLKKFVLKRHYSFSPFYHPFTSELIKILYLKGIPGVLTRKTQELKVEELPIEFSPDLADRIESDLTTETIDFSREGSYSLYNWELFFHAPFLIACQLSQNQRFEEAQKWFHFIFDPTDFAKEEPASVWQTKPFFDSAKNKEYEKERIDRLMRGINRSVADLEEQVTAWRRHPFQPHLLARMRHTTYQKRVLMKYIDNLISWGDSLFRRDTMESINEAALYYVLAAKLLGKRPQKVTPLKGKPTLTYNELKKHEVDSFGNAAVPLLEAENLAPKRKRRSSLSSTRSLSLEAQHKTPAPLFKNMPHLLSKTLYFGIPQNDNLLKYWDTVADRLFKIRNGMNIEGVLRELDLFEPPIDPALLVKAAAKGLNIQDVLSDLFAPTPIYRFPTMVQKALELCNEVKSLGSALLSAIEKKESETLALLRSKHEIKLLELVKQVKEKQIEEIKQNIEGLKKSKESATERYNYYANIEKVSSKERSALNLMEQALDYQTKQHELSLLASTLALIPDFKVGCPPTIGATFGGTQLALVPRLMSEVYGGMSSELSSQASITSTEAGHERRWEDWKLQERLAKKEEENLDKQIAAAEIRQAVAEKEVQNQEVQIANAQEVNEYMHTKFTNAQLYQWMKGQLSNLYFQVYKFAYDIAKRAEKAYQYELGLETSDFIQSGRWDNLYSGLMAGERLAFDLKRLEMSYFESNKRDYEITKNVSLAALNGAALLTLRKMGQCQFSIEEELFDFDFPAHIMRRIKGVSLSIPCIVGPYTNINCKLSLTSHKKRIRSGKESDISGSSIGASVVTSGALNDSGLFEFNFRDERFLPFEGMGAISNWTIKLPDHKQFDYHTISDVILHLRYTAREGTVERDYLPSTPKTRLFSIKHEFSDAWQSFLKSSGNKLILNLGPERFLFPDRQKAFDITEENSQFFAEYATEYKDVGFAENGIIFSSLEGKKDLKDILMIFTY